MVEFKPKSDINELIDEIMNEGLDAIIVDFRLNEYDPIGYRGHDVVNMVREQKKDFPCVILTSNPEDAIDNSFDTYIVFRKETAFGDVSDEKSLFENKLRKSIEHYREMILDAENEFLELSKVTELSLEQEQRLIELDDIIESNLSYKNKVPSYLKESSHVKNIELLVNNTKTIIEKLNEIKDRSE